MKALLRVVEEAQVFHLINAKDERGPVHRPHEGTERGDEFKSAVLATVWVQRRHGLVRKVGQRPAMQVLANPLVDARIAALQVKQRTHDVDVNFLRYILLA